MNKPNNIIAIVAILASAGSSAFPTNALASIPSTAPLRVQNLTPEEKMNLNQELRADYQNMDSELKLEFAELVKRISRMGFQREDFGPHSASLDRTAESTQ